MDAEGDRRSVGSPGHSAATIDLLRRMAAEAELRLGPRHPASLTARSDLAHGKITSIGREVVRVEIARLEEALANGRSVVEGRQ